MPAETSIVARSPHDPARTYRVSKATDAYDALTAAMKMTDPACQDDGRFVLDDQPAETLTYVCDTCDVFTLCKAYARLARPTGAVWAGRRYKSDTTEESSDDRRE